MKTPASRKQLEALAEEIFALTNLTSRARAQARKGGAVEVLTETETLTLGLLSKQDEMTVGEIQKRIGVLPAQMSRIVRALEDKGGTPFIACNINPDDRRKINVTITPDGRKAFEQYRAARMESILGILSILDGNEREEFMRILRKIQAHIASRVRGEQ
jgi:DNA-binding MarR family transcriptional regulator